MRRVAPRLKDVALASRPPACSWGLTRERAARPRNRPEKKVLPEVHRANAAAQRALARRVSVFGSSPNIPTMSRAARFCRGRSPPCRTEASHQCLGDACGRAYYEPGLGKRAGARQGPASDALAEGTSPAGSRQAAAWEDDVHVGSRGCGGASRGLRRACACKGCRRRAVGARTAFGCGRGRKAPPCRARRQPVAEADGAGPGRLVAGA